MYRRDVNYYPFHIYQRLCGKNGLFVSRDIKVNIKEEVEVHLASLRKQYGRVSQQDFLDPKYLQIKEGKRLNEYYSAIRKYYRKRVKETERTQFDTVKILRLFGKKGFGVIDMISMQSDIVGKNPFQIPLLSKDKSILVVLEDDFLEKGRGSKLKLYSCVLEPMLLSNKRVNAMKLTHELPHRQESKDTYLLEIRVLINFLLRN